jgi:hypothetical protein
MKKLKSTHCKRLKKLSLATLLSSQLQGNTKDTSQQNQHCVCTEVILLVSFGFTDDVSPRAQGICNFCCVKS